MSRPFKFRHINEIVGGFVVMAVALIVVAVFVAGRAQGWFEGTFELDIEFRTAEGSYGLQEGAEVQIKSTVAGKVGKIVPTEGGLMMTTLKIKERFRPFVTQDSVIKAKKKFGVAGDAYVEILRGTGLMVEDGDSIECVKDEELMDRAQKMLGEVEVVLLPMLEEVKQILQHVNGILSKIDGGEGIAGAVISDATLKDDIKAIVHNLDGVTAMTEEALVQANGLLSNQVPLIVSRVDTIAGHADAMLTNEIKRAVTDLTQIQNETALTLRETRRLIEGVQRHWLLRKYVDRDGDALLIQQANSLMGSDTRLRRDVLEQLRLARLAADDMVVATQAYNLGIVALAAGDLDEAARLGRESRLASASAGTPPVAAALLEAAALRAGGQIGQAVAMLEGLSAIPSKQKNHLEQAQIELMRAELYLDLGDAEKADRVAHGAGKVVKKADRSELAAALIGIRALAAATRGDIDGAERLFADQVGVCREAGLYYELAHSLEVAGTVLAESGRSVDGGLRLLKAGRSYLAQGADADASRCVEQLQEIAEASKSDVLSAGLESLKYAQTH